MSTRAHLEIVMTAARLREERAPLCYGISNGLGCDRKAALVRREWQATGAVRPSSGPVRWNVAAAKGTAVGDMLEAAARRAGYKTQVPVAVPNAHGLAIAGTADIVGPEFVADLKLAGDSTWRSVQKDPKAEHWQQVHCYAAALGKPMAALWYVRDVAKGEELPVVIHEAPTEPEHLERLIEKWRAVEEHVRAGTLPELDRPPTDFDCRCCNYRTQCHPEAR